MRSSFFAPLFTLALTCTTFVTTTALACGGPEIELPAARPATVAVPHLLAISSHREFHTGSEKPISRTFVLLADPGQPSPEAVWNRMVVNEYDDPQVADAPALATPMAVTLITADGAVTVASTKRVFLRDYRTHQKPHLALEVSAPEGSTVAIAGRTTGTWHALAQSLAGSADQTWLVNHGFASTAVANVSVSTVADTKLVARNFVTAMHRSMTVVSNGGRILAQSSGFPRGVVEISGRLYLVFDPAVGEAPRLTLLAQSR